MKAPFIYAEGKRRYKKLYCHSLIERDNKCLDIIHIIVGSDRIVLSPAVELEVSVEERTNQIQKEEINVYIDQEGWAIVENKQVRTIDVYFEQY